MLVKRTFFRNNGYVFITELHVEKLNKRKEKRNRKLWTKIIRLKKGFSIICYEKNQLIFISFFPLFILEKKRILVQIFFVLSIFWGVYINNGKKLLPNIELFIFFQFRCKIVKNCFTIFLLISQSTFSKVGVNKMGKGLKYTIKKKENVLTFVLKVKKTCFEKIN